MKGISRIQLPIRKQAAQTETSHEATWSAAKTLTWLSLSAAPMGSIDPDTLQGLIAATMTSRYKLPTVEDVATTSPRVRQRRKFSIPSIHQLQVHATKGPRVPHDGLTPLTFVSQRTLSQAIHPPPMKKTMKIPNIRRRQPRPDVADSKTSTVAAVKATRATSAVAPPSDAKEESSPQQHQQKALASSSLGAVSALPTAKDAQTPLAPQVKTLRASIECGDLITVEQLKHIRLSISDPCNLRHFINSVHCLQYELGDDATNFCQELQLTLELGNASQKQRPPPSSIHDMLLGCAEAKVNGHLESHLTTCLTMVRDTAKHSPCGKLSADLAHASAFNFIRYEQSVKVILEVLGCCREEDMLSHISTLSAAAESNPCLAFREKAVVAAKLRRMRNAAAGTRHAANPAAGSKLQRLQRQKKKLQ